MITQHLLSAIWLEGEPHASTAFDQLAADHGREFAASLRDQILAAKQLQWNAEQISGIKSKNSGAK